LAKQESKFQKEREVIMEENLKNAKEGKEIYLNS
jgi:hypothetical protein